MGVEYKHYLIPRDNTYRPEPEDLSRLINALFAAGFLGQYDVRREEAKMVKLESNRTIDQDVLFAAQVGAGTYMPFPCPCTEGDLIKLDGREYNLAWSVTNLAESGLEHPLIPVPDYVEPYYELEFHFANDFVYETSQCIDPFESVLICRCGRPLEFSPGASEAIFCYGRIRRRCSWCATPFRPQELMATICDGWTNEPAQVPGGATYLFAIAIDCGKCWSRGEQPMRASDQFFRVVTESLQQSFYEIGDFY